MSQSQDENKLCYKGNFLDSSILKQKIYMDYQASTPTDPRVIDAVTRVMQEEFGNPHSRSHSYGWRAEELVERARVQVAAVINADPSEIIFTSGATESNNIAIKGVARFYQDEKKDHIITLSTEHKCVIESCRSLESEGFHITYLNPEKDGLLDLEKLKQAITDRTIMVSIMTAHNEIGVIQDIAAIGKITRERGIFFHTDAAQGFGKTPIDVKAMSIDMISISGHKIYGPKGIGALYVGKHPRVKIKPIFSGGGQERGIRSGTLPTPLVVGIGVAGEIAMQDFEKDTAHVTKLRDKIYQAITQIPSVTLNGHKDRRLIGNLNFSFEFIEGESLLMSLSDIAVSSGSACTSATLEPSYVLKALGLKDELAHSSIRFGFGRFTKMEEIDAVIESIAKSVAKLRELSPLWEMHLEGVDLDLVKWSSH